MATQLQLVNRVLRRLREDTVTGITDNDYSELIGEFVLDALEEVQDAHKWESLRHTANIDLVAAQYNYEISAKVASGGDIADTDPRVPNINSELQFIEDMAQCWIRDDASDELGDPLTYVTPEQYKHIFASDNTETNDDPCYFTIQPYFDGTDEKLYMKFYPIPQAARKVEVVFWTPAPLLAVDGTTDGDEVLLPDRPVYLLAVMNALNERGEEMGEPGNLAERRFVNAIQVAIERDIQASGKADRYDWRRD